MSVVTRSVAATVAGYPLSVKGGTPRFDTSRSPHVLCDLTIAKPSSTVLALLDPRTSPAPRVVLTVTTAGVTRTFDLHVRERPIDHASGTVTLQLASDEGLLVDYAPGADDSTPRLYEGSIRGLFGYVLGKAIPGAVLQPGGSDASLTATWDAVNLITNPANKAGGASIMTAGNCTVSTDVAFPGAQDGVAHNGWHVNNPTSADSYISIGPEGTMAWGLRVGSTYVLSAKGSVRAAMSGGGMGTEFDQNTGTAMTRERALVVIAYGTYGYYRYWHSPQVPNVAQTGTNGTRVAVEFTIPPGTTQVFMRAYLGRTAGSISWGLPQLQEKRYGTLDDNSVYFFGSKPASGGYTYGWDKGGAADASPTVRRATVERLPEVFTWKAGTSAIDFVLPLVQACGMRLVCDEQRRWTLRSETYTAPGSLALRDGVNLIEEKETISRDGGYWFDARLTRYKWTDENGVQQIRTDFYALTPSYSRLSLLEINAPYPGPGRSEYAVRRAQGVGREVTVTAPADWSATAEMPLSLTLPDAPALVGNAVSVAFDIATDRMTITTRSRDIPAGAVDLLTGTVNALTGTVNAL